MVVAEEIDTIEALKPRDKSSSETPEVMDLEICGPSLYGFVPMGPENKSSDDDESDDESDSDTNQKKKKNKKKSKKKKDPKIEMEMMSSYYREKLKIYLEILDGYDFFRNCIIVMTTNHLEDIDKAVRRPGRVDHKIEFTFADQYQIKNIFKVLYDVEIDQESLDKMANSNKTTSYIINTAIIPNLDDHKKAIEVILNHE